MSFFIKILKGGNDSPEERLNPLKWEFNANYSINQESEPMPKFQEDWYIGLRRGLTQSNSPGNY